MGGDMHEFHTAQLPNPVGPPITVAYCAVCHKAWPAGAPLYIEACRKEAA